MRPAVSITIVIAVASLVAACASTPVNLVALPTAPAPAAASSGAGPTMLLRPITLPGYLDNYPVMLGRQGGSLVVAEHVEWAERLSTAVTRVLRDGLARRLSPERVLIPGDGRRADSDLTIEFIALDPVDGQLHLDARWTFSCVPRTTSGKAGRTQLDVPLGGSSAAAVATATSNALGGLADTLAKENPCPQGRDDPPPASGAAPGR